MVLSEHVMRKRNRHEDADATLTRMPQASTRRDG